LRAIIASPSTVLRFRQQPHHFSRLRLLTLPRIVVLILRGKKLAFQNALNKVFSSLADLFRVPTASAYCQARLKLKPELFAHLNEIVCQDFYRLAGEEGSLQLWRGHRLLACDGTYLTLPDNSDTRAQFSVQTNQYLEADCVQALSCLLYDLMNDLGLRAALGKRQGEKHLLFAELWQATEPGDVVVLYSDGITDHQSPSGREFGRGRLAQVVRTDCGLKPDDLIVRIFRELDEFNPVAFDDQSIMVMRVK